MLDQLLGQKLARQALDLRLGEYHEGGHDGTAADVRGQDGRPAGLIVRKIGHSDDILGSFPRRMVERDGLSLGLPGILFLVAIPSGAPMALLPAGASLARITRGHHATRLTEENSSAASHCQNRIPWIEPGKDTDAIAGKRVINQNRKFSRSSLSSNWTTIVECFACGEVTKRPLVKGDYVPRSGVTCTKCGQSQAKITLISPPQ